MLGLKKTSYNSSANGSGGSPGGGGAGAGAGAGNASSITMSGHILLTISSIASPTSYYASVSTQDGILQCFATNQIQQQHEHQQQQNPQNHQQQQQAAVVVVHHQQNRQRLHDVLHALLFKTSSQPSNHSASLTAAAAATFPPPSSLILSHSFSLRSLYSVVVLDSVTTTITSSNIIDNDFEVVPVVGSSLPILHIKIPGTRGISESHHQQQKKNWFTALSSACSVGILSPSPIPSSSPLALSLSSTSDVTTSTQCTVSSSNAAAVSTKQSVTHRLRAALRLAAAAAAEDRQSVCSVKGTDSFTTSTVSSTTPSSSSDRKLIKKKQQQQLKQSHLNPPSSTSIPLSDLAAALPNAPIYQAQTLQQTSSPTRRTIINNRQTATTNTTTSVAMKRLHRAITTCPSDNDIDIMNLVKTMEGDDMKGEDEKGRVDINLFNIARGDEERVDVITAAMMGLLVREEDKEKTEKSLLNAMMQEEEGVVTVVGKGKDEGIDLKPTSFPPVLPPLPASITSSYSLSSYKRLYRKKQSQDIPQVIPTKPSTTVISSNTASAAKSAAVSIQTTSTTISSAIPSRTSALTAAKSFKKQKQPHQQTDSKNMSTTTPTPPSLSPLKKKSKAVVEEKSGEGKKDTSTSLLTGGGGGGLGIKKGKGLCAADISSPSSSSPSAESLLLTSAAGGGGRKNLSGKEKLDSTPCASSLSCSSPPLRLAKNAMAIVETSTAMTSMTSATSPSFFPFFNRSLFGSSSSSSTPSSSSAPTPSTTASNLTISSLSCMTKFIDGYNGESINPPLILQPPSSVPTTTTTTARLSRAGTQSSRASSARRRVTISSFRSSGGCGIVNNVYNNTSSSSSMVSSRRTSSVIQDNDGNDSNNIVDESNDYDEFSLVPVILQECIAMVEMLGIETEGLYRVSGSTVAVEHLRKVFKKNPEGVWQRSSPQTQQAQAPILPPPYPSTHARPPLPSLSSSQHSIQSTTFLPSHIGEGGGVKNACVNVDDDNINEDRLSWTGSLGQRFSFDMAAILTDVVKAASAAAPSSSSSTSLPLSSTLVASNPVLPITKYYSGCGGGSLAPSLYDNDIHVLTGTIKSFLRDGMLPDGQALCTDALYGDFIDAARTSDWRSKMIAIQDTVHALPLTHFSTLKFLCQHLSRIADASFANRMTSRNLSIVFGPTLLRPPSNTPPSIALARALADMPQQCQVVEHLIEQFEWVFGPIEFESENENEMNI